jgi:hypothetical protein
MVFPCGMPRPNASCRPLHPWRPDLVMGSMMPGRPRIARSIARTAYVFDFRNQPPATAQHDGSPRGKALLRLNLPHFSRREEMECTQYEQPNGKERASSLIALPEKTPVVSTAATSLCDTLGGLARKKSKKFLELDPDNDPVTPVTIDERADGVFSSAAVLRPGAFVFSGRANCRPGPGANSWLEPSQRFVETSG